ESGSGQQRRGDGVEDRLDGTVELADLGVEPGPASGDGDQGALGRTGRGEPVAGPVAQGDGDLAAGGEAAQLGADGVGCGVTDAVELVGGRGASFIAPVRATRIWRSASTGPSPALGNAVASPASTERAAHSASRRSDVPLRRRRWRSGWFTSITFNPRLRRCRHSPAPQELVPSTPRSEDFTE